MSPSVLSAHLSPCTLPFHECFPFHARYPLTQHTHTNHPLQTNATVLSAGFRVLGALLSVLPGSLAQQAPQVLATVTAVLSQPVAAGTAPLHVAVMGFLGLFVGTHAPGVWGGGLGKVSGEGCGGEGS